MSLARLDPESLLAAYMRGEFPMTDRDGRTRMYSADPRGVLPLDRLYVSKSLGQRIRSRRFEVRVNSAFEATMRACSKRGIEGSWISDELIAAYVQLHEIGFAHSVECWRGPKMVGGLYGVSLGGAFFGESMFHRETDASKVALAALVGRLRERGYVLLDTQATTPHLESMGGVGIPADTYMERLGEALQVQCSFA